MRILQINTFPYKATGNIMLNLHDVLLKNNIDSYVVWGRGVKKVTNSFSIYDKFGILLHGLVSRFFDMSGFCSWAATRKLITYIEEINPSIVHLHNIHGYYLNISMLFKFLAKKNIKVVWTMHDCWAFTGHCAYFEMAKCSKWQNGCHNCTQLAGYPKCLLFDNTHKNWIKKKYLYKNVDITVVCVSNWLKEKVTKSILQDKKIEMIYNGIDLNVFKPTESKFREKWNIGGKKMILGVANEWTERKGIKDFEQLAKYIDKSKEIIVIVGLTKKQQRKYRDSFLCIDKTQNLSELVDIYSSADVLFNPSVEETMGMTLVESLACGTPVVAYDATALPEVLSFDKTSIVKAHDIKAAYDKLHLTVKNNEISAKCRKEVQKYEKNMIYNKYISLYRRLENETD